MMDSENEPQQYQFIQHEFKDINPKEKGGHTFTLEAFKGKAQNNIKPSVVAQDLLLTLQNSGKAMELMETATYEFVMDKQFLLHITKVAQEEIVEEQEVVEEVIEEEAKTETVESTEEVKEEKPEEKVS